MSNSDKIISIKKNQTEEDFQNIQKIEIIRITSDSSLSQLTEEFILGRIYSNFSNELIIEFTYDPLEKEVSNFLFSFFALNILWKAKKIMYGEHEIKNKLLTLIWNKITENKSKIGDGKSQRIIIREPDYLIPEILKRTSQNSFPNYEVFYDLFHECVKGLLGNNFLFKSNSENHVISFLYETSKNSYEHGRFNLKENQNSIFRGIHFNKIVFNNYDEIKERKEIPNYIKSYISNLKLIEKFENINKILVASVSDLGSGIQNTLPALDSNETKTEILIRAFIIGESRKPKSSAIESGYGLSNVIQATKELKAFLVITSGNLTGMFDFSKSDTEIKKESFIQCDNEYGTTLTIFWPHLNETTDQPSLF